MSCLNICESNNTTDGKICVDLIKYQLKQPVSFNLDEFFLLKFNIYRFFLFKSRKLNIKMMDGSELELDLISGSNTTAEQLQKQIFSVIFNR